MKESGTKVVWRFDKKTREKTELSRLGEAPHEFNSPYIKIMGDAQSVWLDVIGQNKVIEFKDSGDFVRSMQVPSDLFHLWKVPDGWLAMTGLTAGSWDKPTCLVFCNDDFSTREELHCWDSEEERGSAFALNPRLLLYDPSMSRTMTLPFSDHRYLAVQIANLDTFYIFDTRTRTLKLEKKVIYPRVKFDREWGEKELEKENKFMPAGLKQKAHFPDYFPRIKFVVGTEWDHVRIHRWNIASEKDQYITYDLAGNAVAEHELAKCSYPIVKIEGEMVYFLFLQDDESWSVGKLSITELLELHKAKPFKFEFSTSEK